MTKSELYFFETSEGPRQIAVGQKIAAGDEGIVLAIEGHDSVCIKIYWDRDAQRAERVRAMLNSPVRRLGLTGAREDHLYLAWPQALVLDARGQTVGFVQTRLETPGHAPIGDLFDPLARAELLERPSWFAMLVIGARVARIVDLLHEMDVRVGDLSHKNIWVDHDGYVTFIDCDSMSFFDPSSGRQFPPTRVSPDYMAPEVIRGGAASVSLESDRFLLAILLCQLMMEGQHPFVGIPTSPVENATTATNIRLQNNRISHPERLHPIDRLLPVDMLPPNVRALAAQCFGVGHSDPQRRPTAAEWSDAIDDARSALQGCARNDLHFTHESLSSCIWCDRVDAKIDNPYPNMDVIRQMRGQMAPKPRKPPTKKPARTVPPVAGGKLPTPSRTPPQPSQSEFDVFELSTWPAALKIAAAVVVVIIVIALLSA